MSIKNLTLDGVPIVFDEPGENLTIIELDERHMREAEKLGLVLRRLTPEEQKAYDKRKEQS